MVPKAKTHDEIQKLRSSHYTGIFCFLTIDREDSIIIRGPVDQLRLILL